MSLPFPPFSPLLSYRITFQKREDLCVGLSYPLPLVNLPYWLVYWFGYCNEQLCRCVAKLSSIQIEPFLTRAEVNKVGVEHYFDYIQVREELGYSPIVEYKVGIERTVAYFKKREEEWRKSTHNQKRKTFGSLLILLLLSLPILLSFFLFSPPLF